MLSIAQYLAGIKRCGNTPKSFRNWLDYATQEDDSDGVPKRKFDACGGGFLNPLSQQPKATIISVYKHCRWIRKGGVPAAPHNDNFVIGFAALDTARMWSRAALNRWFVRMMWKSQLGLPLHGVSPSPMLAGMLNTIPQAIPGAWWAARPHGFDVSTPGNNMVELRPYPSGSDVHFLAYYGDQTADVAPEADIGQIIFDLVTKPRTQKPTTAPREPEQPTVAVASPSAAYARFRDMEQEMDELRLTVKKLTGGAEIAKYVLQQINNGSAVPPALVNYAITRLGGGE